MAGTMELFDKYVPIKFDVVYDKFSKRMVRKSHCPEELKEFCRDNRCFILPSRNIHYYIFRQYIIVSERNVQKRIPHRLNMISLYLLKTLSLSLPDKYTNWLYPTSVIYTYESHTLLNRLLNRSEVISEKEFNQELNKIRDLDIKYLKQERIKLSVSLNHERLSMEHEIEERQRNPHFPYSFDTSTKSNYSAYYNPTTSWGCSDTSTPSNAQNSMVYNSCSGIYSPGD